MMIAQDESMSKLTSKKMIFKASMGHKFINKQSLITKVQAITYSLKSLVNLFRASWILGKRQRMLHVVDMLVGCLGFSSQRDCLQLWIYVNQGFPCKSSPKSGAL